MSFAVVERRARGTLARMHVYESGEPGSPAIVFVHGGGPSGVMWRRHMETLGAGFYCLAPDLPGFGLSSRLSAISLAATSDLLADLIADRVPTGRAHVVGLSYGGTVVLHMLGRHPDRIDRAVVDGAGVLTSWLDPFVVAGAVAVSPIMSTRPVALLLGAVGLGGLGVSLRGARPPAIRRAFREGYVAPLSRDLLEAPCPTLLVAGSAEHTVRASNAAFAALMPHALAGFVPGSGHAWFAWRPELHIRTVEAWFREQELPNGLEPEPPSPAAVDRVRRMLADATEAGHGRRHRRR